MLLCTDWGCWIMATIDTLGSDVAVYSFWEIPHIICHCSGKDAAWLCCQSLWSEEFRDDLP